jgi:hypothetical protein
MIFRIGGTQPSWRPESFPPFRKSQSWWAWRRGRKPIEITGIPASWKLRSSPRGNCGNSRQERRRSPQTAPTSS